MNLILASIVLVVAMTIVRFGARAALRAPGGGWSDRLVEWFVAPGVTMLFALSFGLAFEHFLYSDGGWLPVVVSLALLAGMVPIWRLFPLPAPAPRELTPLQIESVAPPTERDRAA